MLKPYGMKIDCALSGPEAIDKVKNSKDPYSAIFMDHMMPHMDGIEASRLIREWEDKEGRKRVPIIALTANAVNGARELFMKNGFQGFLSKPIDIMRMNEIINTFVRDKEKEHDTVMNETTVSNETDVSLIKNQIVRGLDSAKALARFGDERAYLDALESYAAHTPELLEKLSETVKALKTGDATAQNYAITIHGLKGSSYGIGADSIGKQAENLETAAKADNTEYVLAKTERFIERAKDLLEALNNMLRTIHKQSARKQKAEPDKEVLKEILRAAETYDMGALDKAMKTLNSWSYEKGEDLAEWLREQAAESNLEVIQKRLNHIQH
jgi:CheY-like chemotaxis protein